MDRDGRRVEVGTRESGREGRGMEGKMDGRRAEVGRAGERDAGKRSSEQTLRKERKDEHK